MTTALPPSLPPAQHRHTGSGTNRSNNDPATPRSTSSPALPSTISAVAPLANRNVTGGPTPSPSAPAGLSHDASRLPSQPPLHPINPNEFLAAHNHDPSVALMSLVDNYNTLINSTLRSPEHLQLSKENLKLWNLCSSFKRDRDLLNRQNLSLVNRVQEFEALLKANGVPVPPLRSLSASPVDELNLSPRPPALRSLSDDPHANRPRERKITGEMPSNATVNARDRTDRDQRDRERVNSETRRRLANSNSASPLVASPTGNHAAPLPSLYSRPSNETMSSLPPIPQANVPVTLPHSASLTSIGQHPPSKPSTPGHLSRKASSLDLGRRATPIITPTSRSATPPPTSSSNTSPIINLDFASSALMAPLSAGESEASGFKSPTVGTATPPQDLPDEAKRYILASMVGGLPLASPISPFFPSSHNTSANRSPASNANVSPNPPSTASQASLFSDSAAPTTDDSTLASHLTSSQPLQMAPNGLGFTGPYGPTPLAPSDRGSERERPTEAPKRMPPTRIPSSPTKPMDKGKARSLDAETRPSVSSDASEALSQSRSSGRRQQPPYPHVHQHHHSNSVKVVNSHIKTNERNRDIATFTISVLLDLPDSQGSTRWQVEKKWSDVLQLDSVVKGKHSRVQSKKIATLPDKSLFKDHAPSKVDMRKDILQKYLQSLANVPLQDKSDICAFFNTDVMTERNMPIANPARKTGYLTKKGRNFGGWQTRYYVLQGPLLEYFEAPGGSQLGHIDITGAQIGRQQSTRDPTPNGDSYRHAFLIRESRKDVTVVKGSSKPTEDVDHILCAESDIERDDWVRVLAAWHTGEYVEDASNPPPRQPIPEQRPVRKPTNEANDFPAPPAVFAGHRRDVSLGQSSVHSHGDEVPGARDIPRSRRPVMANDTLPLSSSLPSELEGSAARSNSSLGNHKPKDGLGLPRPMSPEKNRKADDLTTRIAKISGPTNAVPIGTGAMFKAPPAPVRPSRGEEDRRNRVKSSFWNFAGRGTRPEDRMAPAHPAVAPRPVFGVPLQEAVAIARIRDDFELPAVVYRCVEYLEAKSAELEEGIYRLNGSANLIRSLKEKFNHEGDINLLSSGEYLDPHAIAGLLKSFLRDLPVHVLTRELQHQFMQVTDLTQRKDKVNELGRLIAQLPIANYTLLRFLTAHLIHIVQNEKTNKMSLRNVGIVFSPTLAVPATLFNLLLTEFDIVFAMEGDQPAPGVIGEPTVSTVSASEPVTSVEAPPELRERRPPDEARAERRKSRNSVLYETLGADKLLELKGLKLEGTKEDEESENDISSAEEPDGTEEDSTDGIGDIPTVAVGGPIDGEAEDKVKKEPTSPTYDTYANLRSQPTPIKGKGLSINVESASKATTTGQLSPRSPSTSPSPHNASSPRLGLPRSPGLPASPRPNNQWPRS